MGLQSLSWDRKNFADRREGNPGKGNRKTQGKMRKLIVCSEAEYGLVRPQ
jgi:hypothetical protein